MIVHFIHTQQLIEMDLNFRTSVLVKYQGNDVNGTFDENSKKDGQDLFLSTSVEVIEVDKIKFCIIFTHLNITV